MTKFEIDKMFTRIIQEYIEDGYVINTKSMAGSQGEEGKIDLVKEDQLVRIWTNVESSPYWKLSKEERSWHGNMMMLRVGVWKYPAKMSSNNTVWMNDLETVAEYTFYEIKRDAWYTDNLDAALEIEDKRTARWRNHNYHFGCVSTYREDDATKTIATKYLKNKAGYKRVSWNKLSVQKMVDDGVVTFVIIYNGNRFILN